ncbi:MAG: hypothetical protein ACRDHU_10165 [Actinomycetota bacterium]
MKRLLLVAALPSILLLSACSDASEGGGAGSGDLGTIRGTVVAFPACPVESIDSPCPDQPVGGVEVQALRDGSVSATAVSNDDGGFAMDVAPGTYLLRSVVEPEGPGMYSKPTRVTVVEGTVVDATVVLDTGIRPPVG